MQRNQWNNQEEKDVKCRLFLRRMAFQSMLQKDFASQNMHRLVNTAKNS